MYTYTCLHTKLQQLHRIIYVYADIGMYITWSLAASSWIAAASNSAVLAMTAAISSDDHSDDNPSGLLQSGHVRTWLPSWPTLLTWRLPVSNWGLPRPGWRPLPEEGCRPGQHVTTSLEVPSFFGAVEEPAAVHAARLAELAAMRANKSAEKCPLHLWLILLLLLLLASTTAICEYTGSCNKAPAGSAMAGRTRRK